jgi:hypothetical protein
MSCMALVDLSRQVPEQSEDVPFVLCARATNCCGNLRQDYSETRRGKGEEEKLSSPHLSRETSAPKVQLDLDLRLRKLR